jgi:Nif-specific regulatory protein
MYGDIPYVHDHEIPLKDRLCLIEREMINAEIKRYNGNKSKAASEMGISREALRKKLISAKEIVDAIEMKREKEKGALVNVQKVA